MLWIVVALAQNVDRVPEDYDTLQEAVDRGSARSIVLAPGRWAGARVDRPVQIRAEPGAVIDRGVRVGKRTVGLWLVEEAAGSTVQDVILDCEPGGMDAGVVSATRKGGIAEGVILERLQVRRCAQGVRVQGRPGKADDAGWSMFDLRVDGSHGAEGGVGVMAYNVRDVDVMSGAFVGWSDGAEFAGAGIALAGCVDCSLIGNRFETGGAVDGRVAVVDASGMVEGGVESEGLVMVDNGAWAGAWSGVMP